MKLQDRIRSGGFKLHEPSSSRVRHRHRLTKGAVLVAVLCIAACTTPVMALTLGPSNWSGLGPITYEFYGATNGATGEHVFQIEEYFGGRFYVRLQPLATSRVPGSSAARDLKLQVAGQARVLASPFEAPIIINRVLDDVGPGLAESGTIANVPSPLVDGPIDGDLEFRVTAPDHHSERQPFVLIVSNRPIGVDGLEVENDLDSLDFDNTCANDFSNRNFDITNTSDERIFLEAFFIIGDDADDFELRLPPDSIIAGGTKMIRVRFRPASAGLKQALLVIQTSDPFHPEIMVELTGVANPAMPTMMVSGGGDLSFEDGDTQNLGTIEIGGSTARPVVIHAQCGAALTVSPSLTGDSDFQMDDDSPFTVESNDLSAIWITFAPTTPGPHLATLTLTTNAGPFTLYLVGNGDGDGPTPEPDPEPDPDPVPSPDDGFEENDTRDAASAVGVGTYSLVCLDDDWFAPEVAGCFSVTIDGNQGDLDLLIEELIEGAWVTIGVSESSTSHESVMGNASGPVRIHVFDYNGDEVDSYSMTIIGSADDDFEDNETQAVTVQVGFRIDGLAGLDDDWFAFEGAAPAANRITVTSDSGDLDLEVIDAQGFLLGESDSDSSNESVDVTASGKVFVHVYPWNNRCESQSADYSLLVDTVFFTQSPDNGTDTGDDTPGDGNGTGGSDNTPGNGNDTGNTDDTPGDGDGTGTGGTDDSPGHGHGTDEVGNTSGDGTGSGNGGNEDGTGETPPAIELVVPVTCGNGSVPLMGAISIGLVGIGLGRRKRGVGRQS